MKTIINGFVVEGSPEELRQLFEMGVREASKTINTIVKQKRRRIKGTRRRWVYQEEATLKVFYKRGDSINSLAKHFNRTPTAIYSRVKLKGFTR